MEKNIARSLLEKLQTKMKEEIDKAKADAFTVTGLKLAEEQMEHQKKLNELQQQLDQLQQKQAQEIAELKRKSDEESKALIKRQ
jgi:hypothetical protein